MNTWDSLQTEIYLLVKWERMFSLFWRALEKANQKLQSKKDIHHPCAVPTGDVSQDAHVTWGEADFHSNHICRATKQRWQLVGHGLPTFCVKVYSFLTVRVSVRHWNTSKHLQEAECLPVLPLGQIVLHYPLFKLSLEVKFYLYMIESFSLIILILCSTDLKIARKLFSFLCTEDLPCNLPQSN